MSRKRAAVEFISPERESTTQIAPLMKGILQALDF
jgi:hypothetical protein